MYHIYHTDAIVLFYRNFGEADRLYTLFTRELGLVTVRAQGVRKLESKTRFSLALFSHAQVDLVRGKDMWRLASARPLASFALLGKDSASLRLVARLARLTKRLCVGEGREERILEDLLALFTYLNRDTVTEEERKATELTYALRLLHVLGYVGATDSLSPMLSDEATFGTITAPKKTLLFEINRALKESHL